LCHVVGLRAPPPGGGLKNTRTCAEHTILSRYTAHERVRTYAHTHPPFEERRRKSCPFKSRSRPKQLLPDDSTRQSIPDPPPSTETPEALELEVQAEAADAVLAADRARAQQLLSKEPPGEPLALALAAARGGGRQLKQTRRARMRSRPAMLRWRWGLGRASTRRCAAAR
jgi:hypothetical protein